MYDKILNVLLICW